MTGRGGPDARLPDTIRSRFAEYPNLSLKEHQQFIIGRLLEEGTRSELGWLFSTLGRPVIESWWAQYGGRALSQRSRALWRERFGEGSTPSPLGSELWLLA